MNSHTDKKNRNEFLPYGHQWIDDDDIKSVVEVLKSDYLTTGPKVSEFEDILSGYLEVKHTVAVSNGTAALHAACFAAGIGVGDEVITSPITFAASANCVLYTGGKPVFADIDPKTYNIDPEDIKRKITPKTKAIIPVHFTGAPCDMDKIVNIAEENRLIVIEDGAHALGAEYKGVKVGGIGHMTTFSFHPVKHITTGEGGAITTNSDNFYERLEMFRTHGITRDKKKLTGDEGSWYYEQQLLGFNYRLNDIQAALGISQMRKLDGFLRKRRKYANIYDKAFENTEGIISPYRMDNTNPAWHLYIIQLELEKLKAGRKEIFDELRSRNIGVNVHYVPVYFHPFYRELGYARGLCPAAERLYERIITLPLFPAMDVNDVFYVIDNVKEVLKKFIL